MVRFSFTVSPRRTIPPTLCESLHGKFWPLGEGLSCRELSPVSAAPFVRDFILCAMITVHAQFRAGVQGTISDSAGALVPDAKVVLKDTETGKTQEATQCGGLIASLAWPRENTS